MFQWLHFAKRTPLVASSNDIKGLSLACPARGSYLPALPGLSRRYGSIAKVRAIVIRSLRQRSVHGNAGTRTTRKRMNHNHWYPQLSSCQQQGDVESISSPSSIPSLTHSSSSSRPSSTETQWYLSRPIGNQSDAEDLQRSREQERLDYAYESQSSMLDQSLPSCLRNRTSGGFFRRLLQNGAESSTHPDTASGDCSNGLQSTADATMACETCFSRVASQKDTTGALEDLEDWPLPPTLHFQEHPESPVLGAFDSAVRVIHKPILPAVLSSSDLSSDLGTASPVPETRFRLKDSDVCPTSTGHSQYLQRNPTSIKPSHSDPARQFWPTPSQTPFVQPIPSKNKQSAHRRKPSIAPTLQFFPSPPIQTPSRSTSSTAHRPSYPPQATSPDTPTNMQTSNRLLDHRGRSSEHRDATDPNAPQRQAENLLRHHRQQQAARQAEEEREARERELVVHSLRYEDAARCSEPFRTLWAAELSGGGGSWGRASPVGERGTSRREREGEGRRGLGRWWS